MKNPQITQIAQIKKIHRLRGLHRFFVFNKFNPRNLCNLWIILICVIHVICGCKKQDPSPQSADVLATVNGRAITQADFDYESALRPGMSPDEILHELIKRQALILRAEESGIAETPALKRDLENRLISEWLAGSYRAPREGLSVTEDELRAAYEDRREKIYTTPSQARFAILYQKGRNTDELTDALNDAIALFEADRDAATNNSRLPGFGKIAADYSEDTISRFKGGDIGWLGEGTSVSRVPAEVLAEGWKLGAGEVAGPMVAGDGVYAILKISERDAAHMSYNDAAPTLRARVMAEKQAAFDIQFNNALTNSLSIVRKAAPVATPRAQKSDAPPFGGFGAPVPPQ